MKNVMLKKTGCFVTAVGKDAEIIAKELGYNVTCAFPVTVLDKNIERLKAKGIECRCRGLDDQKKEEHDDSHKGRINWQRHTQNRL